MKTQTDARQLSQTVGYDLLGRKVSRTWTEPRDAETWSFAESWVYENASLTQYGVLKSQERQATVGGAERERWSRSYTHDALNRVTGQSTTLRSGSSPAVTLTQSQRYDTRSGQLKQSVYPAGSDGRPVSLYHLYDEAGFLRREGFAEDYQSGNPMQSPALRSVLTMDGRGTITQQNYGSRFSGGSEFKDWASHAVYDQSGWLLGLCVNWGGDCSTGVPTIANPQMPLNQRYRYDVYGNLKVQYHRGAWLPSGSQLGEERYSYDPLHRLIGLSRMGASASASVNYAYDEIGNLRKKSDWSFGEGAYQYPSNSHRLTQVSLSNGSATNPQPDGTASYQYDGNGNVTQRVVSRASGTRTLTVGYDIDNLPWKLSVSGVPQREARYSEGPEGRYWQRLTSSAGTRETAYLGKALEREWSAGVVTDRYYLTEGVLLVVKSSGQRTLNYLHQDRLGSPVSISEKPLPATGGLGTGLVTLVEHRGFDPYGKALDGGWGTSNFGLVNLSPTQPMNVGVRNQRGFTGHEHLDEFELIHMNGRLYDYNLGRFYGVDPFVQFPANSQSLNPYSYLMNNPLAGTDPTGYAQRSLASCQEGPFDIGCGGYSGAELFGEKDRSEQSDFNGAKAGGSATSSVSPESLGQISDRVSPHVLPYVHEMGVRGEPGTWGDFFWGAGKSLSAQSLLMVQLGMAPGPLLLNGPIYSPQLSSRELSGAATLEILGAVGGVAALGRWTLGKLATAEMKMLQAPMKAVSAGGSGGGVPAVRLASAVDNATIGGWGPGKAALEKVPSSWGPPLPAKKGVGVRWTDPADKGNGIRIDAGNPANSQVTQQIDHVIVRHNGVVIGRSGKPISGSVADNAVEAHIPLSEWQRWANWFSP